MAVTTSCQVFNAVSGGANIGGLLAPNGVAVSNGIFTVTLDFGSAPFTGPARWLDIAVRTNGAGGYTTLNPRQPLTPTSYAIYANSAGTVTNGAIANAQLAASSVAAANIQNSTITAGKIASGQVVKSLNGLKDDVAIAMSPSLPTATASRFRHRRAGWLCPTMELSQRTMSRPLKLTTPTPTVRASTGTEACMVFRA